MPLPPALPAPQHVHTDPSGQTTSAKDTTSTKTKTETRTMSTTPVRRRTTNTSPIAQHSEASGAETSHVTTKTTDSSTTTTTSSANTTTYSSSSSIRWGPAITASPFPSSKASSAHQIVDGAPEHSTGPFSGGAQKALISATTIGGTLVLIVLFYALWRRRKGATYSEIIQFRPHSSNETIDPGSDDPRLTALPIYKESRFSMRSSWHASVASVRQKRAPGVPGVPAKVAERFYADNPWVQSTWKTSNPPTPPPFGKAKHPLATEITTKPSTPQLKQPEMTRVETIPSTKVQITPPPPPAYSGPSQKPALRVSVQEASFLESEKGSPPDTPKHDPDPDPENRWSWTNSQAPPTPKLYAQSKISSKSSIPTFRSVASWVRNQAERGGHRIDEERLPLPTRPTRASVPKDKLPTSKPPVTLKGSLSPKQPIVRKLSKKRNEERASMSSPRKRSLSMKSPTLPQSAYFSDERARPSTAAKNESNVETLFHS